MRLWVKRHDAERLAPRATSVNGAQPAPETKTPVTDAPPLPTIGPHAPSLVRELDNMRRQIQKLQAENDVLKRAFVMFSSEWAKQAPSQD